MDATAAVMGALVTRAGRGSGCLRLRAPLQLLQHPTLPPPPTPSLPSPAQQLFSLLLLSCWILQGSLSPLTPGKLSRVPQGEAAEMGTLRSDSSPQLLHLLRVAAAKNEPTCTQSSPFCISELLRTCPIAEIVKMQAF